MSTYSEQQTVTGSNLPPSINFNAPIVHSLNSYSLEQKGWVRNGMTWEKDGKVLTYDGAQWKQDGIVVDFFEDLK